MTVQELIEILKQQDPTDIVCVETMEGPRMVEDPGSDDDDEDAIIAHYRGHFSQAGKKCNSFVLCAYYFKGDEPIMVTIRGRRVYYDTVVNLMDDGLREQLRCRDWKQTTEQERAQAFTNAYCKLHRKLFKEDFVVN